MPFISVIILLSLIEVLLILSGLLPPVSSYSAVNLPLKLLRWGVIVYVAVTLKESLVKSATKGAILSFAGISIICMGTFVGNYLGKPVLGVPVYSMIHFYVVLIILILENVLVGALVAACSVLIAKKLKRD